jgi:hypothetical protein
MILGTLLIALEFPLPMLRPFAIHRSIVLRIVLLLFQTFVTILFYQVSTTSVVSHICFPCVDMFQGTNAAIWSFISAICYTRAQILGETIVDAKENRGKAGGA